MPNILRTDLVMSNALARVFHVRSPKSMATAFTMDVDGRRYVITAKHFAEELEERVMVQFQNSWREIGMTVVGHGQGAVDISVLALHEAIGPDFEVLVAPETWHGQHMYFIGFPFGLRSEAATINEGWSIPLVKSAYLSAWTKMDGQYLMILDGHNNVGFSGGPVVCFESTESGPKTYVAGVISCYRVEPYGVFTDDSSVPVAQARGNSGIIFAWDIHHAVELIRDNPVGLEL